jgi:hypothetical protein
MAEVYKMNTQEFGSRKGFEKSNNVSITNETRNGTNSSIQILFHIGNQ